MGVNVERIQIKVYIKKGGGGEGGEKWRGEGGGEGQQVEE